MLSYCSALPNAVPRCAPAQTWQHGWWAGLCSGIHSKKGCDVRILERQRKQKCKDFVAVLPNKRNASHAVQAMTRLSSGTCPKAAASASGPSASPSVLTSLPFALVVP